MKGFLASSSHHAGHGWTDHILPRMCHVCTNNHGVIESATPLLAILDLMGCPGELEIDLEAGAWLTCAFSKFALPSFLFTYLRLPTCSDPHRLIFSSSCS